MPWIDPDFPPTATLSECVGRVLGLNPGPMTGPGTNTYLVGRRTPILIDTGAGEPGYLPLLERYLAARGLGRPARVLLTHRHRDHLGGVPALRARWPDLPVAKLRRRDGPLPEPVEDLRDGEVIAGDGVTLVALHTPGHASDHLCYYLPEEQALFTGDLVLGGSTTVIPADDGDLEDYLASLRRIQGLALRRIYPAHGPVIEDPARTLAEYLEHRMLRERQILAALAEGPATVPELVARIYHDVAPALHPAAAQSVQAHLRKLAREGRARALPDAGAPPRWALAG